MLTTVTCTSSFLFHVVISIHTVLEIARRIINTDPYMYVHVCYEYNNIQYYVRIMCMYFQIDSIKPRKQPAPNPVVKASKPDMLKGKDYVHVRSIKEREREVDTSEELRKHHQPQDTPDHRKPDPIDLPPPDKNAGDEEDDSNVADEVPDSPKAHEEKGEGDVEGDPYHDEKEGDHEEDGGQVESPNQPDEVEEGGGVEDEREGEEKKDEVSVQYHGVRDT